jgi:hypothetical protein
MATLNNDEKQELLKNILLRYEKGSGANDLNRRNHTADLMFCYGSDQQSQWDPAVLTLRMGRPSYTFNRILQPVNLVTGDQRQTRPAVKVRPASENATTDVADILGGLWRSIEQESRAEAVYDETYKQAVAGGFGELMMLPEYESDQSFNQVLRIRGIPNPLTVVRDPEAVDPCGADAEWAMVANRISKEKYEELYPDFDPAPFPMSRDSFGWRTDGMVRVVDYFERIAVESEIAELTDGRIIDYDAEAKKVEKHLEAQGLDESKAARVKRTRKVKKHKIRWVKTDGAHILEGPVDYDWQRIPVVRMPGRYINIEGRQILQSLVRHSWDSQRAYNFQASDAIERSALVPKARYLVTPKMVAGLDDVWNSSNATPRMYLPYNIDPGAPNGGMPKREDPIDVPAGAVAMAQMAAQDIQASIGMYDPALGNSDDLNRASGKALVSHTRRSDLGTHEFIDNYGKALQLLCEMGLDMIPTVYDAARVIRVLDAAGKESHVNINQPGDGAKLMNSLKQGRYDCTVTLGPSYQTARQEALDTMLEAVARIPMVGQVSPDLIARLIDVPESAQIAERLHMVLAKQGVVKPDKQDLANMPPQQGPDPMQQAELERAQALASRDAANAQIAHSKAAAGDLEIHKVIMEAAGKHLANMVAAQKLGQPAQAALSEAQAAQTTNPAVPAAPGAQQLPNQ